MLLPQSASNSVFKMSTFHQHSSVKGAITSKIKHAQLLRPSLAFCFSLQPMTAYRPVLDGTLSLAAS